ACSSKMLPASLRTTIAQPDVARLQPEIVARPAGEHENLQLARGLLENREHHLEPRLVGVDQGIIEDETRPFALTLEEEMRERQTDEHGNLLASTDAQQLERLVHAVAAEMRKRQRLGVDDGLCRREQTGETRAQPLAHGGDQRIARGTGGRG